jgi:HEAT repeat protein
MKRLHLVFGLLLLTCLARSSGAEEGRRIKTYEASGVAIEAGFVPDETQIILGQPLFITFTVTTRSKKSYRFFVGGDNRGSVRHNNFRITATDAHGKPVKDPYSYNNFGGFGKNVVLERGQNYSERLFLGHWCAFDRPGLYTVTCKRILKDYGEKPRHEAVPVTSSFELTIVPFEAKQMRDVITGLGKKLRDGKEQDLCEASLALAAIADEQVIPHLALSLSRGDYQNKLPAIRGLAQFPSDAAADALLIALKDPDHAVRDAGGDALRKIERLDQALQSLLPDLRHKSPSVRARTAQALGTTKAKGAFDALLKATHDSEPAVRHAAAIGLGTLGHKEALQPLEGYLEDKDMGMRVAASKGLRALGEPLQPEWLTPVIRTVSDLNDQNFHEAIRLIRLYGGEEAAPALVSCLNFDDPSPRNSRNMFLLLAIHHSPGGPQYYYKFHSDPNTDGTPEQIEKNRQILAELRKWLQEKH